MTTNDYTSMLNPTLRKDQIFNFDYTYLENPRKDLRELPDFTFLTEPTFQPMCSM